MVDLLLLGIIPGTNIQINFADWLLGAAAFVLLAMLYIAHKKRVVLHTQILLALRRAVKRAEAPAPQA